MGKKKEKKKKIPGSHCKTIEADLWQVGPSFPGDSDIQPGLKTMHG